MQTDEQKQKPVKVILTFENQEDADRIRKYHAMAQAQDGTVGGVWAGIMCSALKRAKINKPRAPKGDAE